MTHKIHEGRNVKRFREMLGIKQDAPAADLGDDWNQKKISLLEQKETIEPVILKQVSVVLNIPIEAFQNFDEEQAINIISNTVNNNDHATGNSLFSYYPAINPVEKIVQLHEEKNALYERMLQEKEEMIARLERLLEKR